MWRDVRYAVQGFWRSPVFTVSAVLALGLAIGANATIFGLIDGLWFRPPGVARPGEIVRVFSTTPAERDGYWSYPEYLALRDQTSSFAGVVAKGPRGVSMPGTDGTPELLLVNVVTTNFFTTLGVAPAAGRLFTPADEASLAAEPGVVLGHEFWRRRFGSDPSIVGQTIRLMRGVPVLVTVLGVLPETFRDLDAATDRDLWLPPATWVRLSNPRELEGRDDRWFQVTARRRPGVSVQAADADVVRIASNLAAAYPATNAGRGARAISDLSYRVQNGGDNATALLGLVLLVVLITCVNVANLLLARAAARTRELAVRVALGATRRRLVRQLMTESAILGGLGALAGLTLSLWLIGLLPALVGTPPGFRSFLLFQADARVFAFTLAITMVTTFLFGIAPSWMATRTDVVALMKGEATALGPRRSDRVLQQVLVISQVAVSLVLLCAAAVLARSFAETGRADLGVTRKPLLTAWITGEDFTKAAVTEALRRVEALPGVTHAAIAVRAPLSLSGGGMARPVYFPEQPPAPGEGLPQVRFNPVSAGYFETVGTRLLRGRLFSSQDEGPGEPVIVVNEQFERQYFPGRSAIDQRVQPGGPSAPMHRIVGIVQDAVINDIGESPEPYFYLPYWRQPFGEVTFLVQVAGDPAALAPALKATLKGVDPHLDPRRILTMRDYIDYAARTYRATAVLAAVLAGVGLLLTVLGIYGVVAYRTANRTREIGIRVALGARRGEVVRLVMREGAVLAALGLAIGVPAALASTRVLGALVFRVSVWDPPAFGAAAVVLFLSVCAATAIPAWRATRITPSTALRDA